MIGSGQARRRTRRDRGPRPTAAGRIDVLHVAQPEIGGVPDVVAELVRDQAARGWGVAVASPAAGHLPAVAARCGARHLSWEATRSPGVRSLGEARALRRIVREVQPDVVHLHSSKAGLAGRLVLRGRRPTIFQPHAWSFHAVRGLTRTLTITWERYAARWTDAIVCVSEDERREGTAVGISGRWRVLPNGVRLDDWPLATAGDRAAAREALGLGAGPLAVCIGRLSPQKGQTVLLQAWGRVVEEMPSARLALVGEGPDRGPLARAGVPGVIMPGWTDDVAMWTAAADIVVVPSLWEAGLTLVAMQAMSRGRSVVATDVAGMRAGVGSEAGAVVPVGDPTALAEAIAIRLRDERRRETEGRAGRRIVEERFDGARTYEMTAEHYLEVLRRREDRSRRG